ncbi:MAG TPA: hypothetical protein VGP46_08765 [Acidimicrobiales bacterium]|nr:hypothetical protein [Acidimicrobiales bacterium]
MTRFVGEGAGPHDFGSQTVVECVEVHAPARPEMWGLFRMAVSTVASVLDMSVDKVEDLRIAVDELSTLCAAGAGADSDMHLVIRFDGSVLEVACTASGLATDPPSEESDLPPGFTPRELSERILEALVDEYGLEPARNDRRHGWFLSRK